MAVYAIKLKNYESRTKLSMNERILSKEYGEKKSCDKEHELRETVKRKNKWNIRRKEKSKEKQVKIKAKKT